MRLPTADAGFSAIATARSPWSREGDEDGAQWDQLVDEGDTPYEALRRREQIELITQAIRGMDERLRVALVLRHIEGLSYNEIAETLQISLGTVKSRILRGREALRARLQREVPELAPENCALQTE